MLQGLKIKHNTLNVNFMNKIFLQILFLISIQYLNMYIN